MILPQKGSMVRSRADLAAHPLGLEVTALSDTEIDVEWLAPDTTPAATSYSVQRSTTQGGPYTEVATPSAPTVTFSDTGLDPETTYYYIVKAVSLVGTSGPSAEASATTEEAPVLLGEVEVRETNAAGALLVNDAAASGQQVVGGAVGARAIYIENIGAGALVLGTPAKSGAGAAAWTLSVVGFDPTLGPGESTSFTMEFDDSPGTFAAEVSFTHDSEVETSPFIVNYVGSGSAP